MYVLLIHSAVFDRVVSRWRSSFVLLTNSFAEAGSDAALAEAGAAPWEGEGAAREDDGAEERTRAALQSGKNRMAAETTAKLRLRVERAGLADERQLVSGALRVLGQAAGGASKPPAQLAVDVLQDEDVRLHVRLVQAVQIARRQLEQPRVLLHQNREWARLHLDERGLAEEVARRKAHELHRPARLARAHRGQLAGLHDVHRASLIPFVEDHRTFRKRALDRHRDEAAHLRRSEAAEERRLLEKAREVRDVPHARHSTRPSAFRTEFPVWSADERADAGSGGGRARVGAAPLRPDGGAALAPEARLRKEPGSGGAGGAGRGPESRAGLGRRGRADRRCRPGEGAAGGSGEGGGGARSRGRRAAHGARGDRRPFRGARQRGRRDQLAPQGRRAPRGGGGADGEDRRDGEGASRRRRGTRVRRARPTGRVASAADALRPQQAQAGRTEARGLVSASRGRAPARPG